MYQPRCLPFCQSCQSIVPPNHRCVIRDTRNTIGINNNIIMIQEKYIYSGAILCLNCRTNPVFLSHCDNCDLMANIVRIK